VVQTQFKNRQKHYTDVSKMQTMSFTVYRPNNSGIISVVSAKDDKIQQKEFPKFG
jgi:hypothetical protein